MSETGDEAEKATGWLFRARSHENRELKKGLRPDTQRPYFRKGTIPDQSTPQLRSGTAGRKAPPYRYARAPTTKSCKKASRRMPFCGHTVLARDPLAEQKLSETRRKGGRALTAYSVYAEVDG